MPWARDVQPPQVLIVEDDPQLRTALAGVFADEGYQVGLATNGLEAVEWLEGRTPCVVVLDLLMPGVVGHELLEHMRTAPGLSRIPVAIISGSPELAPPGYTVFPKPIDDDELLAFARRCCHQRES